MATLATNVSFQCFGLDGKPLAGGKVYTYSAGTTTSKATYTTMAGTVANPNPVILDQSGKAKIFLGDGSYRLQIKDSNDALIDDIDQISRYVTQSEFATFQQTVNDGVTQLTEVREQIDVFVNTSIGNQKGFANGIAPLDPNVKIDPIYLPTLINTPLVPKATETALGVAKIATTEIAQAGTNDADIITAKKLRDVFKSPLLGLNQKWVDKKTSRVANTSYQNNTGKNLYFAGSGANEVSGQVSQDGVTWVAQFYLGRSGTVSGGGVGIVPSQWFYRISGGFSTWWEMEDV